MQTSYMKYRILLLPVILFIAIHSVSGQKKLVHTMTSQYYGVREGLAQMQTFRVFQDSYGYIWTVFSSGVSRFDGKTFRTYTSVDIGAAGRVLYINQYKESVFFVTRDGISFLHPDGSKTFCAMPDDYKIKGGFSAPRGESMIAIAGKQLCLANCVVEDNSGVNRRTFFMFDLEHKSFKKFSDKMFDEQLHVADNKLIALKNGKNSYLKIYDVPGDTLILLKEYTFDKKEEYHMHENICGNEFFLSESDDDVTRRVYSCFLLEDNTFSKEFLCEIPNMLPIVRRIDENKFIVAAMSDTYLIDGKQRRPFPINTVIVNYAMKDCDGNLWLATEEGLINCYHMLFDSYKLGVKHNDYIWTVGKDYFDNIWFGSYGSGFWRADKEENITKAKVYENGRERTLDFAYMSNAEDSLGRIFFGSEDGIAVFDPRKGNLANLSFYKTGVSLAVYYDTITNCIFSGGEKESKNSRITTLICMNEKLEMQVYPLNTKHIITISRDAGRRLRIGTYAGEYIFDEDNEVFVEDTLVRPYRGVISMKLDRKGFLWKGTTSGVYAEDSEGNLIKIQETPQDASFLVCYDDRYVIWGFADKLAVMDLPTFHRDTSQIHIRMFDVYSGYDVMEAGQNGDYVDKDGYVWIIGSDRVLRFHPDELMAKPEPSVMPPYIAAVFNKDKDHDWMLARHDSLVFENKNNNLRFDLLQASVVAPDELIFRYRLNGYSDHWVTTNERSIVFQNLSYGKFYFEVQSSINGEEWSKSAISQPVTIKRPFWLTLHGLSLLSTGLLIFLFSIAYWARRLSIKKQEEKQKIERLKYRAVQSKFIPHFTGNVLNSINYLISKDPELAQKYIIDFSGFSRQTLLYSEKLHRTLKEELDYIELYLKLEKMRFEEDLEYYFNIDPVIDMGMKIPMMILQTFCENAMKHGLHHKSAPGFIKVEAQINGGFAVLSVEDDGIGREKARELKTEGSKEGLNIVNEQLKFFNKTNTRKAFLKIIDLFDDNGSSSGTRFELHIPVKTLQ